MSIVRALKWSFAAEFSVKAVQPIVFIVLARLLTPDDFGVMTAAVMVMAFSQIFWEAGMSSALIQRQLDIELAANCAFIINLALGGLIATLLYFSSEGIAQVFFQDSRVANVLKVMTLQVLLGAFSSVQTALLQKNMDFKPLFFIRLATVTIPGVASIYFALNGWGYWALIIGVLVGQSVQVVMLFYLSKWKPSFNFSLVIAKEMLSFSIWVAVTSLLAWSLVWIDSMMIARNLGVDVLGLYKTASNLANLIFMVLLAPVLPVIYSYFSKNQGNKYRVNLVAKKIILMASMLCVPAALFFFQFSKQLGNILFDQKWFGIGAIFGILALREGLAWVTFISGEYYRSVGKPRVETAMMVVTLIVYLPIYYYCIPFGIETFSWGRVISVLITMSLHLVVFRYLGVGTITHIYFKLVANIFMYSALAFFVFGLVEYYLSTMVGQLLMGALIFLVGFIIFNLIFEKFFWQRIYKEIRVI
jgi:PST family polysaccharide transporter